MSPTTFQSVKALVGIVKRLWFRIRRQSAGPRKGLPRPPEVITPRHRHCAFFELP